MGAWQDKLGETWQAWRERWLLADHGAWLTTVIAVVLVAMLALGWYWSREPRSLVLPAAGQPGEVLAQTLVDVAATLRDKPGGYLHNDMLPPGLLLDDMPSWELGVLRQVRDLTRALHRDMGLSHADFAADADLAAAEAAFNVKPGSWLFPRAEAELADGEAALRRYRQRLAQQKARFYTRPAYLQRWLADVDGALGMSTGRLNAALMPLPSALDGSTGGMAERTPWYRIDNVFYEARGEAWALLQLLRAVEVEYADELDRRQVRLSLRAAIHELEATQQALWSPVVLNGSGFGLFANHSLVMANYLARVRADLADVAVALRESE